jgi:hypothetical protein
MIRRKPTPKGQALSIYDLSLQPVKSPHLLVLESYYSRFTYIVYPTGK